MCFILLFSVVIQSITGKQRFHRSINWWRPTISENALDVTEGQTDDDVRREPRCLFLDTARSGLSYEANSLVAVQ